MIDITTLSILNLITATVFAFTIRTGILENFLSKIGNLRAKKLARSLLDENKNWILEASHQLPKSDPCSQESNLIIVTFVFPFPKS